MSQCIFCKIVTGEIPSFKVYEDEYFLAFMDVFPRVKGHILVIPKEHYRWTYDVPNFGEYWEVAKKVGLQAKQSLQADFLSFVTFGEAVHHAHIHVLPQFGEEIKGVKVEPVIEITKDEIANLAKTISQYT